MLSYGLDFLIVSVLIIGLTAFLAPILKTIFTTLFGRKRKDEYVKQFEHIQNGWNAVKK